MAATTRTPLAEFTLNYEPRDAFLAFHQRTQRWAVLLCHRRAGKTVSAVHELFLRAMYTKKKHARYAYIAPFRQQAKQIAWLYLQEATQGYAVEVRESDLSVRLPNNALITLYGSDNPSALRGIYLDGVVVDEFAEVRPSLWAEVILPTLADRKGWAVLCGTVKGARNQLWQFYEKALADDNWFTLCLKADTSGIIDPEELEVMRRSMSDDKYKQEFLCDPNAAIQGTYYTTIINKINDLGQININTEYDPSFPVNVAADLGRTDSTVLIFYQELKDRVSIIDCEAEQGVGVEHYLQILDEKPYEYDEIWLPHDAVAMTLATKKSTADQFIEHYQGTKTTLSITPRLSVQDGIEAARLILPHCHFNQRSCDVLIDALRTYRRKYNELTQAFIDTPLHSWESDYADAFRYLAIVTKKRPSLKLEALKNDPKLIEQAKRQTSTYNFSLSDLYTDRERATANRRVQKLRI